MELIKASKKILLRITSSVFFTLFIASCSYEGKIVQVDDVMYEVKNGNAVVVGYAIGSRNTSISIRSRILNKYNVIGIANNAFANIDAEFVNISDGVKYIGNKAFANCTQLHTIIIPKSITEIGNGSFINCRGLLRIEFPDSLTKIADSLCYNANLHSVVLPKMVKSIGKSAFENNHFHENGTVYLPDSIEYIGDFAFCRAGISSLILPSSLKKIGKGAFLHNKYLGDIFIPESVEYIEADAFRGCFIDNIVVSNNNKQYKIINGCLVDAAEKTLVSITSKAYNSEVLKIPYGIEELGYYAIYNYKNLEFYGIKKIILPETIKKLYRQSFVLYPLEMSIEEFVIPASVEYIEEGFIDNYKAFMEIKVNPKSKNFKVIDDVLYDKSCTRLIYYSPRKENTFFQVPSSVRFIDREAFSNCKYLKELNCGKNVHVINDYTGDGHKLSKIECPGVDSLMRYAFKGNGVLTYVFSDKIRYIHCSNLRRTKKIYCNASEPPMIGGISENETWNKDLLHIYVKPEDIYNYQNDETWRRVSTIHILDNE